MGLIETLRGMLPTALTGGGPTPVFYEATIYEADGEDHRFDFLYSTDWDRPIIVWNEREFHMPADPAFTLDARGTTSLLDREFDLLEISWTRGQPTSEGESVDIPAAFVDHILPEVDRTEDELRTIFRE